MPLRQKTPNAKLAKARKWKHMKKHGLQPGDNLPAKKSRRRRYPPLTKAQQKLVEEHRWIAGRLAYSAKAMTGGHMGCYTKDDLESVAFFALCVAATRYDPSLGWKFSTFAWGTARGWIQHALRDFSRMVRIPRWIGGVRSDVKEMLNQGSTYEEIMDELDLDFHQVLMCDQSWQEIHSSYDHTPDESRPKEFVYEVDEVRAMLGVGVFEEVGDLTDSEIELMLLHVEGELETEEEKNQAESLMDNLKKIIGDRSYLG
jgi:DNA-directed RNA polymerase specialized sigma subunit